MRLIAGLVVALILVLLVSSAVLFLGWYDVAAAVPAGKLETTLAQFALNKSVARRAPRVKNPIAPSPEALRTGLAHFRENCADCHGAPGIEAEEFAEGLNPPAPDLTLPRVQRRPDGELFWIVSNGIRMTGMPAFGSTHKEDEIWKIVAFLRHLPELTPDEEKLLKRGGEDADHHHEEEAEEKPAGAPASGAAQAPPAKTPHAHAPGAKPHAD